MPDYKAMYYHLAGRMAGTVEALEAITEQLKKAQQTTENMFINNEENAVDDGVEVERPT
jgi:hypothetical protein